MSGAISSTLGLMPNLLRGIDSLSTRNEALTAEESSGIVSNSFAGLGAQTYTALSLQPQITATAAWQTNLSESQTKLSATQTALTSISSIASNLQTSLLSLTATSSQSTVAGVSAQAKQELTELGALLNTQSGASYVFAGTASDQPPVSSNDLATTGLVSSIISTVASVGTTGAAATEGAAVAAASDNSPAGSVFSAQLSTSAVLAQGSVPQLQIGLSETISNGIVATQGGAATAQSTGSPIRDLITALATAAGLAGADQSSAGFTQLVSDTASQMTNIGQGIQGLIAQVGQTQATVTDQSSALSDVTTALQAQLGNIMNADEATVASQQAATQTQLTASYTLIADMKTLSLAQYI